MCKLPKQSNLYLVIFIVVAVVVGGFFYFQKDLGFDFWDDGDNNVVVENGIVKPFFGELPEGVEIIEFGDKRVLKDERNKIEIEMDEGWIVKYVDETSVHVGAGQEELEAGSSGIDFEKYDKLTGDLKTWIKGWIKNSNCPECYNTIEYIKDNVYRVEDRGAMGEIISYFFTEEGVVYQVTIFDKDFSFDQVIKKVNIY